MNKVLTSLALILLVYGIGTLLGIFFGINMVYVLPFIGWFIALILFYLILDEQHTNIFMETLKSFNNE